MNEYKTLNWAVQIEKSSQISQKYKDMMLDYIDLKISQMEKINQVELSWDKWFSWREMMRNQVLESLGLNPLPIRSPLHVRSMGIIDRDEYFVEKLLIEPRPFFLVSAHLYIPKNVHFPIPGILYSVGHWMKNGKMEPDVQNCCIGLVKLGFVVLVYDPIGQGERGCSFYDHGHRDILLLGLSQEGLMVWESIRMIDYLLTRPEVDGNKLGMTGASGGGLNTLYTCVVDERISVIIPVCYITSFTLFLKSMRGLNWNGGIDLCNQVPGVMRYIDMAGLCSLIAQRPLMLVNGTQDPQFPIEGARNVFGKVRKIYESIGFEERIKMVEVVSGHGYNRPMRESAYGWFKKWLMGVGDGNSIPEPEVVPEPPNSLQFNCFAWNIPIPSGPVISRLSRGIVKNLPPEMKLPSIVSDWRIYREGFVKKIKLVLDFKLPFEVTNILDDGKFEDDVFITERSIMESEEGITIPFYCWRLKKGAKREERWLVLLNDDGKLCSINEKLLKLVEKEAIRIFALDVRCNGETTPIAPEYQTLATTDGTLETIRSKPGDTLEFEIATNSMMLGSNLLGQQVADLVLFLKYLRSLSEKEFGLYPPKISIFVSGIRSSLIALFASVIEDWINGVILDRSLLSYLSLVGNEGILAPMGIYVFGILQHFDLPQVATLIAPRRLIINRCVSLQGEEMREVDVVECRNTYSLTQRAYEILGYEKNFCVERESPLEIVLKEIVSSRI